jgi:hypothetical protein
MRLLKYIFLGTAVMTISMTADALYKGPAHKPEVKPNDPSPYPVMEPGARVFAGDPQKNEFYILSKNQPDPVKPTKIVVNTYKAAGHIDMQKYLSLLHTSGDENEELNQFDANKDIGLLHAYSNSPTPHTVDDIKDLDKDDNNEQVDTNKNIGLLKAKNKLSAANAFQVKLKSKGMVINREGSKLVNK